MSCDWGNHADRFITLLTALMREEAPNSNWRAVPVASHWDHRDLERRPPNTWKHAASGNCKPKTYWKMLPEWKCACVCERSPKRWLIRAMLQQARVGFSPSLRCPCCWMYVDSGYFIMHSWILYSYSCWSVFYGLTVLGRLSKLRVGALRLPNVRPCLNGSH